MVDIAKLADPIEQLPDEVLNHRLGTVELLQTEPVVAGETGQWTLVYTVGSYGVDEGGTLKVAQRFASDWEIPQFDQPTESGYTTVTTTGEASLRPYYHAKSYMRPFKCLVIDVYDGSLAPGDTVTITYGDQSQGSPGSRAQTFQESAHEFRFLVDPTNASVVRRLPTSPYVPIVAGEPVELVAIVPTRTVAGQSVQVFVKGQDRWGNPTPAPKDLSLNWEGEPTGVIEGQSLTIHGTGTGHVIASAGGMRARSNAITACSERPAYGRYWGDLHAQTNATVGTGTEAEYFTFARDWAHVDFTSHQGNDFQMTDEDWKRLNDTVAAFHKDGRFVVFPGYEWSANSPAGGDRNVFYLEEGMPIFRSSHWQIPETPENELTPAHPADVLFDRVRQHVDLEKVLLASHVGGRYADIRKYLDEELAPLVEVVSCWGVFEWMLWDAFEKGAIVGVMCNSDGHKGRPGAEGPGAGQFGIASGLTCVLAESLTRDAVFKALKQRRCYGTTGARIDLDFEVDGQPMGSVLDATGPMKLTAAARGDQPLEALMLYRGKEVVQTVRPAAFERLADSPRLRVVWRGARIRGRGRRVDWTGTLQAEGVRILSAETYSFDSAADGITEATESRVAFRSQTTGDADGLDLMLDKPGTGRLVLDTAAGRCEIDLAELTADSPHRSFEFGGLDIGVEFQRYPVADMLTDYELHLEQQITAPAGATTPWFVKVVQTDGQMAWSSPIYVKG